MFCNKNRNIISTFIYNNYKTAIAAEDTDNSSSTILGNFVLKFKNNRCFKVFQDVYSTHTKRQEHSQFF